MVALLYIAVGYLLITSVVLYLNLGDFDPLMPVQKGYFDEQAPKLSICIPARNEANSIERCVRSAIEQHYPNHNVFVLDDGSTDKTSDILANLVSTYPERLSVIEGAPKPDDWLGKSWACHQLAQVAEGEILVFIDADTWLEPNTMARLVRSMGHAVVDFITIWPEQKFGTFWEKIAIPLVYFALLTLLPVRYVKQAPKWLPPFIRQKVSPLFTAACGQFMAFKRKAYNNIDGHASVKNEIVEDVALAKNIKRSGFSMKMYHGNNAISCRMYNSGAELWEGFRKNFLAGFGYNIPFFMGMGILQFITFVLPFILLPFVLFSGNIELLSLTLGAIGLSLLQHLIINRWFNWSSRYGFLYPLAVCWYESLGIRVLLDYFEKGSPRWKDRKI